MATVCLQRGVHRSSVPHIRLERQRLTAAINDGAGGLACAIEMDVAARDRAPFDGKALRDRTADARAGTGDECEASGVTLGHLLASSTSTMKSMSPRKYVAWSSIHRHVTTVGAEEEASVRESARHLLHVDRVHGVVLRADHEGRHVDVLLGVGAVPVYEDAARTELARTLHRHVDRPIGVVEANG